MTNLSFFGLVAGIISFIISFVITAYFMDNRKYSNNIIMKMLQKLFIYMFYFILFIIFISFINWLLGLNLSIEYSEDAVLPHR